MDITLAMLGLRIPEIIAAALRERQAIEPVWTYAPNEDPNLSTMAAAPPDDHPGWRLLARGERWGVAPGDDPNYDPPRLRWNTPLKGGSTHWLRAEFRVPPAWHGSQVALGMNWKGDGLDQVESIVYCRGSILAGLDWGHRSILLDQTYHHGSHPISIRSAVAFPGPFGGLELQRRDQTIFQLGHAMRAVYEAITSLPADANARPLLLTMLQQSYRLLDLRDGYQSQAFAESAVVALAQLTQALQALPADHFAPSIITSGHGHLDVAWLWPLWRTRQKVTHTVANTLALMERYPDYHFSMSQPHVYAFLKQDDPALFERLRQQVVAGRFEPVGMMWVEPDCNLSSGESLVRQLFYGAQFFAREFPERYAAPMHHPHVVWLPDVFGFNAALPQILRGVGINCFLTTKLSWNQVNRMPADTFRWRGIDGSEVLAHFLTASDAPSRHPSEPVGFSYGGMLSAGDLAGSWRHYQQKNLNRELLYLYGHGDGGGGPTEEMLEASQTLAHIPGIPRAQPGRVDQFFAELYQRVWHDPRLPRWSGELSLEYHRGTFTSQAAVKQANRRAELLYREAEWANAWAVLQQATNQQPQLDHGWQTILLNQFHDILPGSSIAAVYRDAHADYQTCFTLGETIFDQSLTALTGPKPATSNHYQIINSLPWEREDIAYLPLNPDQPAPNVHDHNGQPLTSQRIEHGDQPVLLVHTSTPAYGWNTITQQPGASAPSAPGTHGQRNRLESPTLRVEFDDNGEIASLYDRINQRELVQPGARLNQLVCYEDRPLDWDSWDIDHFYSQKPYPIQQITAWEQLESGPLRSAIRITRRFGQSSISQLIGVWHHQPYLDMVTDVDWQERQMLLRTLFPLNLNPTHATCEIPFGALERPVHRNTSWEQARFEVCAHRWVDVAEAGYGVALLNDGKYGHSFEFNTLGLSLLKSGTFPDQDADRGQHHFCYRLFPHAGDWRSAQVVRRAYELNARLRLRPQTAPSRRSFLQSSNTHVVIETVKVANDGDGLIIRLYEAHNQRGPVTLTFEQPLASAELTNLLEQPYESLHVQGQQLQCEVRPFEIKTIRIRFETRQA